jgi:hypothetical protein
VMGRSTWAQPERSAPFVARWRFGQRSGHRRALPDSAGLPIAGSMTPEPEDVIARIDTALGRLESAIQSARGSVAAKQAAEARYQALRERTQAALDSLEQVIASAGQNAAGAPR